MVHRTVLINFKLRTKKTILTMNKKSTWCSTRHKRGLNNCVSRERKRHSARDEPVERSGQTDGSQAVVAGMP